MDLLQGTTVSLKPLTKLVVKGLCLAGCLGFAPEFASASGRVCHLLICALSAGRTAKVFAMRMSLWHSCGCVATLQLAVGCWLRRQGCLRDDNSREPAVALGSNLQTAFNRLCVARWVQSKCGSCWI